MGDNAPMNERTLGRDGLDRVRAGPRLHGHGRVYGPADDERVDRDHPPRARPRRHVPRHGRHLRPRHTTRSWSGRRIAGRRDEVVLATKFAHRPRRDGERLASTARPSTSARPCEASLRRLGVDTSTSTTSTASTPNVPIEETVGAMAELVAAGQGAPPRAVARRAPRRIRRARRRAPDRRAAERVVAVDPRPRGRRSLPRRPRARHRHRAVQPARPRLPHRRDHQPPTTSRDDDFRRGHPRFQGDNFEANLRLVDAVRELAADEGLHARRSSRWPGCSHQGDDVVPIPGTKRVAYLEENVGAADVELSADDLARARRDRARRARRRATATRLRAWRRSRRSSGSGRRRPGPQRLADLPMVPERVVRSGPAASRALGSAG